MISLTSPIQNWIAQFSKFSNDEKLQYLAKLDRHKKIKLIQILSVYKVRKSYRFYQIFPDEGQYKRELYVKHVEFFDAGGSYRSRLFMAGNCVGKTVAIHKVI